MNPCVKAAARVGWSVRVNARVHRTIGTSADSSAVAAMFGLSAGQAETLYDEFRLEIKPGMIVLATGPSGAGKSVLLREVARQVPEARRLDTPALSACEKPAVDVLCGGSLASRLKMLSRCGLAEATALVTPAMFLSGGQRSRLALARVLHDAALADGAELVIADEFCSTLDRQTARGLCRRVRKLVTRSSLALLVATPRPEIAAELQPDLVILKPLNAPARVLDRPPRPRPDELRRWPVTRGSIRDYRELAGFHYIAGAPACHKRVYVIRRPGGASSRRRWDRIAFADTAAVAVVSPPLMNVRGRNIATGGRYSGRDRREAIARLNREMECISRVIVHPTCRGSGLAERLVRHALATAQTPLVEALAAMGRVHPFLERAGMSPTHLEPDAISRRLLAAAEAVGLSSPDVAAVEPVRRVLAGKGARQGGARPAGRAVGELRRAIDRGIARATRLRRGKHLEDPLAEVCRRTTRQYVYYLWKADE